MQTCYMEKAMAPHSSTLPWKIPWMEEPGGLQSMGSLRVRHNWATSLSLFHFHALEKEMATHSSVLAWRIPWAGEPGGLDVYGVTQSQTWLKWLSSSSSRHVIIASNSRAKWSISYFRISHTSMKYISLTLVQGSFLHWILWTTVTG